MLSTRSTLLGSNGADCRGCGPAAAFPARGAGDIARARAAGRELFDSFDDRGVGASIARSLRDHRPEAGADPGNTEVRQGAATGIERAFAATRADAGRPAGRRLQTRRASASARSGG